MDQLIPLIDKAMNTLSEKLGVGLDAIWSALINQATLSAQYHHNFMVMWSWAAVITAVIGGGFLCLAIKDRDADPGPWLSALATSWVAAGLFCTFYLTEKYEYLTAQLNGPYWAVNKILSSLAGN